MIPCRPVSTATVSTVPHSTLGPLKLFNYISEGFPVLALPRAVGTCSSALYPAGVRHTSQRHGLIAAADVSIKTSCSSLGNWRTFTLAAHLASAYHVDLRFRQSTVTAQMKTGVMWLFLMKLVVLLVSMCHDKVEGRLSEFYRNRGRLIFHDEFITLNTSVWQHIITAWRGGNNEFEYYTDRPENSYVENGVLHIRPTLTAERFGEDFLYNGTLDLWPEGCNINYNDGCVATAGEDIINPIQSARMRTINSFSFTYGTVEIRAKMPRGDWIWPAMWLMPTQNAFGAWPRSGEIDMVEIRANDYLVCNGKHMGNRLMGSTLHFGTDPQHNIWRPTHYEAVMEEGDFASDFHIYGLQRTPEAIRFYVDGILIGEVILPAGGFWELGQLDRDPGGENIWANGTTMTPFDYPFHFILNVAVGGNFFPDGCACRPHSKPWRRNDPQQMYSFWEQRNDWLPTWSSGRKGEVTNALQVDYIRVYDYDPNNRGSWHWYHADGNVNSIYD